MTNRNRIEHTSSSSCSLPNAIVAYVSTYLFLINCINFSPCHYLRPSNIIALSLPHLPLIFPAVTKFLNAYFLITWQQNTKSVFYCCIWPIFISISQATIVSYSGNTRFLHLHLRNKISAASKRLLNYSLTFQDSLSQQNMINVIVKYSVCDNKRNWQYTRYSLCDCQWNWQYTWYSLW